jgi:hypothetical protein
MSQVWSSLLPGNLIADARQGPPTRCRDGADFMARLPGLSTRGAPAKRRLTR